MTRRQATALLGSAPLLPAQDILDRRAPEADARIPYGKDTNQFADLRVPVGAGPHPVLVMIHGGFWRAKYDLEHCGTLCEDLKKKGIATWSLEYRRVGQPGGGYPGTLNDVVAGIEHLKKLNRQYSLDVQKAAVMGHSAGGHLALYAAGEARWLQGAISLAGVADLRRASELKLGNGIVNEFAGGAPTDVPDHYKVASPIERLPLKKRAILIHGEKDDVVPVEISRRYEEAARKTGDKVKLVALPNTGHFELIDPSKPAWAEVESAIREILKVG